MRHIRTFQQGPFQSQSQQLLNEITTAKLCLLKPIQKATYDGKLKEALAPSAMLPTVNSFSALGKIDPTILTTGQRRKPKNAVLEFAKIVVGGMGGLFVAWLFRWTGPTSSLSPHHAHWKDWFYFRHCGKGLAVHNVQLKVKSGAAWIVE